MTNIGITAYGCGPDEVLLFKKFADHAGVKVTITEAALSENNIALAAGNRCISIDHKTRVTPSILLALSKAGVEYISTRSIGYNHIDMEYAKDVGITVGNVVYSSDSVADYTLMLMLMLLRDAKSTISQTAAQNYRLGTVPGKELRDLTVGVVGSGRIGAAVVKRLQGFGCRVLVYDRRPKTAATYVPFDELITESDIITLHTPLNGETFHLLNQQTIRRMKPGTLVVNTGRGALIDTEALVEALESQRLGGAALDVLEGEEGIFYADHTNQPIEHRLLGRLQALPNVIITPHTAFYTDHALHDMVEHSINNCLTFTKEQALWTR